MSSRVLMRIACLAALALLFSGCKGSSWSATPLLNTAQPRAAETRSRLAPLNRESIVYAFKGGTDGALPAGSLVADKIGALYGTTEAGGSGACSVGGCGTVFKLTPASGGYAESVVYSFKGGNDGAMPMYGVIVDAAGALYGTTINGGVFLGGGTVFKLTPSPSGYVERVLYSFRGGGDGAGPTGLVEDKSGALYGTTEGGGDNDAGTVFKLAPFRRAYKESILYRFRGYSVEGDGYFPEAGLVMVKSGALYGTTALGGTYCYPDGCGIVFELKPSKNGYAYRVLHNFKGPPRDGAVPRAVLLLGGGGTLFGTTIGGGSADWGTVFKLKPSGGRYAESLLHSFGVKAGDGQEQVGGVISDAMGALYGTTAQGGSTDQGVVFKLRPSGNRYDESLLHTFRGGETDGAASYSGLLLESGALYGVTSAGGANNAGTVYKVAP